LQRTAVSRVALKSVFIAGGEIMADDKSKRDVRDRNRVSADEDYEVRYFAEKAGITPQQVRDLISKHGNDRATLEREAKALKGR
jgi:hypothetical protein